MRRGRADGLPGFVDADFRRVELDAPLPPIAEGLQEFGNLRAAAQERGQERIWRTEYRPQPQRQDRGTFRRPAYNLVVPGRNFAEPTDVLGRGPLQPGRIEDIQADAADHGDDRPVVDQLDLEAGVDARADLLHAAIRSGKGVLAVV